jgi:hypothetical protein
MIAKPSQNANYAEKSVADPLAARNWRSALALRKNLKSRLVNVGPREDQKHNCRRDKQR